MIEFLFPWALVVMPLPLIVWLLVPKARQEDAALHTPFYGSVSAFQASHHAPGERSLWRRLMLLLIWLLLILAAIQPQFVGDAIELPTTGRDLMLAVDISGSMGTDDMEMAGQRTTRLDVVKSVISDFVERRKGDRLGLILFGSKAYLQTPLTFDRNTVQMLLQETPLGIAGGKTAIGDAIGLAVKRLQDRPSDSRVVVLLTDGVNNVGEVDPIQAAKVAERKDVRIHTIGFGA
ncbi:MAG: VWA domain-containing protein, partial [Pseudomonadales bacterium]|nr:VWA domain-containing protein [Pseudomonadales bacterium]